jgi:hypothetical protein
MVQSRKIILIVTALLVFFSSSAFGVQNSELAFVPVTGTSTSNNADIVAAPTQSLTEFSEAIQDGNEEIRGVYVENVMALKVIQQPANKPGYVSSINGIATQFGLAEKYGTVGLLAHNFASGSSFDEIEIGAEVRTITGKGDIQTYQVVKVVSFQALSPNSQTSSFRDLATDEEYSAGKLFEKIYQGEPHLVLQTCIANGSEDSWGRLFIIAEPVESSL